MDTARIENDKLAEELMVAQSIFPEELHVASSCQSYTTLEVHWKGCDFVLQVRPPASYPSTCPIFLGIDRLAATADSETRRIINIFEESLIVAYIPGQHSLIEALQLFQRDQNKGKYLTPKTREQQAVWKETADLRLLIQSLECSICLEEYPSADVVLLECQHTFCADCFAGEYIDSRRICSRYFSRWRCSNAEP